VALVDGLAAAGLMVAVVRIGEVACAGRQLLEDAGASLVLEVPQSRAHEAAARSTPGSDVASWLTAAMQGGPDAIIVETAGDMREGEAAAMVESPWFRREIDQVLLCAADAATAQAGVAWLRSRRLSPVAVTGALAQSADTACQARTALGLPVLTAQCLAAPFVAPALLRADTRGFEVSP
jgi:hypothetical protein